MLLHMNREFILQHTRKIHPKLSGQNFNGTLVQVRLSGTNLGMNQHF